MLRLSRERLLVALEPAAVSWVWVAGGIIPRVLAERSVPADPASGAEPWASAVASFTREAEAWRKAAADVTVVLSNDFVRYAIVPPTDGVSGPEEELALARFHFSRVHGAPAKNWDVRLSPGKIKASRLACAVDTALVQSLKACFPEKARAHLKSIQPYLMSAFNRWRREIPRKGAWLVLVEPERVCLALSTAGAWQAVANRKGSYPAPEDWATLLDRERLCVAAAATPETVLVCAAPLALSAPRAVGSWKMRALAPPALPGLLPEGNARYAMALTAR